MTVAEPGALRAGWRPPSLRRAPMVGAMLLVLAASLVLPAEALEIAQRERINPGLTKPGAPVDRSTPARSWRSFMTLARSGQFKAAAHCLDLTEVPEDQQELVGVRTARQLYRVLTKSGAAPGSVVEDTPAGPMENGQALNFVVAYRINRGRISGEVWLRRTEDQSSRQVVWLFTRRTVSSVADWYREIVEGKSLQTSLLNPGLGEPPATVERESPRAAVRGFLQASGRGQLALAANYLDLGGLPREEQAKKGPKLARRLRIVLDREIYINTELISNDPGGAPEAGLDADDERIASIKVNGRAVPILLHRTYLSGGGWAWTFSRSTVGSVDFLYSKFGYGWLGDHLPAFFFTIEVAHVQLWQWCGILLLLLLGWFFERLVSPPLMAAVRGAARKTETRWDDELAAALDGPVRLGILALFLFLTVPALDLSGPASTTAAVLWKLLGVVFVGWLLSRWVEIVARFLQMSAVVGHNEMARSFIPIFSRITKVGVWCLAFVIALDSVGVHVMGLVAGLGIGGMAVAFAAKDSIENVFGSLAIAADTPFKIGHFVKIGGITGTVESVGLRSTRLRTLDRTLVTVPNGRVISEVVENYSQRDRFKYETTIGLLYSSTAAQLAFVIDEIKKMLLGDPRVYSDGVRVRLARFAASSIDIDILTWVTVEDYSRYTAVAEELNFQILGIVARSGTDFAFPSQTLYLHRDAAPDGEIVAKVEEEVARRREKGDLWIPEPPQT